MRIYRFGDWLFRSSPRSLFRAGELAEVRPQALLVLDVLLFYVGCVVSREQLQKAVFADRPFMDHRQAINLAVLYLRRALGDDAKAPRFVETVARQGYRFIHPVEVGSESLVEVAAAGTEQMTARSLGSSPPSVSQGKPAGESFPTRQAPSFRRPMLSMLVAVSLAGGLAAGWLGHDRLDPPAEPRVVVSPLIETRSPQDPVGGDPLLATAVTDELVAKLHRRAEGRWLTATLARGAEQGAADSATRLTGSLRRADGGWVVTLRLYRPGDGVQLWTHTSMTNAEELGPWLDAVVSELARFLAFL